MIFDNAVRRPSPVEALALVPVTLGAVLATFYALGTLLKTAELRGAHLSVRDTLPLVPLPQLLVRGAGVVTDLPALLLVLVLAATSYWLFGFMEEKSEERRRRFEEQLDIEEAAFARLKARVTAAAQTGDEEAIAAELSELEAHMAKTKAELRRTGRVLILALVFFGALSVCLLLSLTPILVATIIVSIMLFAPMGFLSE